MTKFLAALSVLVLVGCGGNDFHSLFGPTGDAAESGGGGTDVGTGGAHPERPGTGGMLEADAGRDRDADGAGGSGAGGAMVLATGGTVGTGGAPMTLTCSPDQKLCDGKCLTSAAATPSLGCWEASCTPCSAPPAHAHSVCVNGQCGFDCNEGYQRSGDLCIAACGEVVHNDGLGQMWSDCAPLGTFTQDQAEKACAAWCVVNGGCHCAIGTFCGDSNPRIYALVPYKMSFMTWVWQGDAGNVVQADPGTAGQPMCTQVSNWN